MSLEAESTMGLKNPGLWLRSLTPFILCEAKEAKEYGVFLLRAKVWKANNVGLHNCRLHTSFYATLAGIDKHVLESCMTHTHTPERQTQKRVQVVLVVLHAHILQRWVILQLVLAEHHLNLHVWQRLVDAHQTLRF